MTTTVASPPRRSARRRPPPRWPLEPVPGMAKLTICAAKTKAPVIPISGASPSPAPLEIRRHERATTAAEAAQKAPPTAGERRASAMCTVRSVPAAIIRRDGVPPPCGPLLGMGLESSERTPAEQGAATGTVAAPDPEGPMAERRMP